MAQLPVLTNWTLRHRQRRLTRTDPSSRVELHSIKLHKQPNGQWYKESYDGNVLLSGVCTHASDFDPKK